MPRCVAVIPARGGSKSVPRKNVMPIGGVPLIGRSVRAALGAKSVDAVYVSTDDAEIAAVARRHGAAVIDRPAEISGDAASSESALFHALDTIERETGATPELLVFLQCTSPFTTSAEIDQCVAALDAAPAMNAAFAAIRDHGFLWRTAEDGEAVGVNHDHTKPRKRRQELEPAYRESGSIYVMRVAPFRAAGNRFSGRAMLVPIEAPPFEIDHPEDFAIASAIVAATPAAVDADLGKIRALVMDFDGVLTDNRVLVMEDGREAVLANRGDGMGLGHLKRAGVKLLILSKERNPVVSARAKKLGVEAMQGIDDKLPAMEAWLRREGVAPVEAAYIGNDANDVACMLAAGWSAAPADAHGSALEVARHVCRAAGGAGAVREVADLILAARGGARAPSPASAAASGPAA